MTALYCNVCKLELSVELVKKGSSICSPECKKAKVRIRRAVKKSGERCPTCRQKLRQKQSARVRQGLEVTS